MQVIHTFAVDVQNGMEDIDDATSDCVACLYVGSLTATAAEKLSCRLITEQWMSPSLPTVLNLLFSSTRKAA